MRKNFSEDFHVNQARGKLHEATILWINNVALFSLIVSDPARVIICVNIYRTRKPGRLQFSRENWTIYLISSMRMNKHLDTCLILPRLLLRSPIRLNWSKISRKFIEYFRFSFQRKHYVKYAKVFPMSNLLEFRVPSKWYRRAIGGIEVICGGLLAGFPNRKFYGELQWGIQWRFLCGSLGSSFINSAGMGRGDGGFRKCASFYSFKNKPGLWTCE